MKKPYDVFLSYKSDDANFARPLAETLLANGVVVWFAEYSVSLDDWLNLDDDAIDEVIRSAIRSSEHVVLITTSEWHASDWCRREYEYARSLSDVELANIRLCPTQACATLQVADHRVVECQPWDVARAVAFLEKFLNRKLRVEDRWLVDRKRTSIAAFGRTLTFSHHPLVPFNYGFLKGVRSLESNNRLRCLLRFFPERTTGQMIGLEAEELASVARDAIDEGRRSHSNDRNIYREYAQRAQSAARATGMKVVGLHLIHLSMEPECENMFHGRCGFAITRIECNNDWTYVMRAYHIRLANGEHAPIGEFAMLFDAEIRKPRAAALKRFWEYAPNLDLIVQSARYNLVGFKWRQHRLKTVLVLLSTLVLAFLLTQKFDVLFPSSAMFRFVLFWILVYAVLMGLREWLLHHGMWPGFSFQDVQTEQSDK